MAEAQMLPPGREKLLTRIDAAVSKGEIVLLYGPVGIGKTTLLSELARRIAARGTPCGTSAKTESLGDVTAALARAYPDAKSVSTQRGTRSRLRLVAEEVPGILLLDHLGKAGTAAKGFLRELRRSRLGVVIVADAENERDHAVLRAMRLTHIETKVPPLSAGARAQLLDELVARRRLPFALLDDDRRAVLRLSGGNPGRLVRFAALLADERTWHEGRIKLGPLRAAVSEMVLRRYWAGDD